ncbi:phosphatidylinositol-specific phospholipase C/glycerophosphodiester phosphodiesterase family protein [Actinoplanes sp. NPDC051633]|uniref:phosphatidylinositol-specific phospholipase C/glycerophosphodiester phosphodiesterase family protein n=1 Tax=Actinoplanes sp. NPDC051633 TaxID=3155670 RepID=UPI003414D34E
MHISRSLGRRLVTVVAVASALLGAGAPVSAAASHDHRVRPLAQAHAHNDYEHERPLLDALSHGFTSVEADVYLVGGELLVAHDPEDVQPGRTLQSLYLEPLARRVRANHGTVYRGSRQQLQLLIDIKNTGALTYTELHRVLTRYRWLLTTYAFGRVRPGAVTAVISGDRPRELMEGQRVRYAFYDGRLTDLGSGAPASFIPLISDNWTNVFTWQGSGPMPAAERSRLRQIIATAHRDGQRVRFWATPDTPGAAREAVWTELLNAGVDHINTDDLAGLEAFLRSHAARRAA